MLPLSQMFAAVRGIPRGVICKWYGLVSAIPAGWALCDGNNGTPNLRGFFVMGAFGGGDEHDTGGSATHNHPFTGDGHTHPIMPIPPFTIPGGAVALRMFDTTVTGTTDNTAELPPYHKLAYIMKL